MVTPLLAVSNGCRYLLHDRDQIVLSRVSGDPGGGRREVPAFTSQKSQSERLRGTLGTFDKREMPIATDLVRRKVIAARGFELSKTLSPPTKPPR
jgi:hypothetical protein